MFRLNHIHLKSLDRRKTAQWYVEFFGAEIVGEGEGLGGSSTVRMDIEGTRINVNSALVGKPLPDGTAVFHYGLEHLGFDTDDIDTTMANLEAQGVEVFLPVTFPGTGSRISYIKGR